MVGEMNWKSSAAGGLLGSGYERARQKDGTQVV